MSTTGKLEVLDLNSPGHAQIQKWDEMFFQRPWTSKQWGELNSKHYSLLTWTHEDQAIGFALFGTLSGDEAAHLYKIFILPEYRGKKEAELFLKSASEFLESRGFVRIYLEVEMNNPRAIGFYEKFGFQRLRVIKGYYSDGVDGLTMDLTL